MKKETITIHKIKVGIEEFTVHESDIPRITAAMQSDEMVQLDCGIFRGKAILAVFKIQTLVSVGSSQADKLSKLLAEARNKCTNCKGVGSIIYLAERVVRTCPCQKNIVLPETVENSLA